MDLRDLDGFRVLLKKTDQYIKPLWTRDGSGIYYGGMFLSVDMNEFIVQKGCVLTDTTTGLSLTMKTSEVVVADGDEFVDVHAAEFVPSYQHPHVVLEYNAPKSVNDFRIQILSPLVRDTTTTTTTDPINNETTEPTPTVITDDTEDVIDEGQVNPDFTVIYILLGLILVVAIVNTSITIYRRQKNDINQ